MAKCPVCDWEIKDRGVRSNASEKSAVYCCKECAEKAAKGAKKPKR